MGLGCAVFYGPLLAISEGRKTLGLLQENQLTDLLTKQTKNSVNLEEIRQFSHLLSYGTFFSGVD